MGFQVLLDIAGALLLGGIFSLGLVNFQVQNSQLQQENRDDIIAQQNLIAVVQLLEDDFQKIGYCRSRANMAAPVITSAGRDYITFKTDFLVSGEGNGIPDSVSYKLGNFVTSTPNPNDKMLLRRENANPYKGSGMGITYFELKYLRYNGDTLARPVSATQLKEITAIEVSIRVENQYPFRLAGEADSLNLVNVNWKQLDFEIKNFGKGAI